VQKAKCASQQGFFHSDLLRCYWLPDVPVTVWQTVVAATLAAILVGYSTLNGAGERLPGEEIFNSVLVLLVVTSFSDQC
jgi:hypothetical protein